MERLRRCFEVSDSWPVFIAGTEADHDLFIFNLQDEPEDREEFNVEELNAQRPFVYMFPDYPQGFVMVSDADGGSFRSGGVVQAYMETTVERLTGGVISTQQEVARLWDNLLGVLFKEIFFAGWNGGPNESGILDIRRIDTVNLVTPKTITEVGQGDYVKASFKVHWGREA